MRELKFRAWDKEIKKMSVPFQLGSELSMDTIDKIFMQYTGLKDKNGKEIYEGDICRTHYYEEQSNGATILSDKYKHYKNVIIEYQEKTPFCGYTIHRWYEIIGNIYESPELLEDK